MKIHISESAFQDLANGYDFYDAQEKGLGAYFQESLFSDIDSLKIYAGVHQKYFGKYRMLSRRFPFAIYYTIDDEMIIVSAILDCRRNPLWPMNKLK